MSVYGDIPIEAYDSLAGQAAAVQAQQAALVGDTSSIGGLVGAAAQVVGFTVTGQPAPINVGGDSNGVGLSVTGAGLVATLSQDIKTTASPTFVNLTLSGAGGLIDIIATRKSNLSAAVAPTANEDSGDGYAVGSIWIDTTADDAYICCDATVAAAVWKKITP